MGFGVRQREEGREGGFEGIERSAMAMEFGPHSHRDAYQTFFILRLFTKITSPFLYSDFASSF